MQHLRFQAAALVSFATLGVAACGARTGLLSGGLKASPSVDAGRDATVDATVDAGRDSAPDAVPDAIIPAKVPYCIPSDPSHIYVDGNPIATCDFLQQCEEVPTGVDAATAECINPCLDSLGSNTSNGCEFYAMEIDTPGPGTAEAVAGACYAVFIVNQWQSGTKAKIEVSRGGQVLDPGKFGRIPVGTGTNITYAPFDPDAGLPKDQVVILFLSRQPVDPDAGEAPSAPHVLAGCPAGITPAYVVDTAVHGTGQGETFHISTNVPVVAYQMYPYGAGRARVTSATLLLPTNVWDTNYVVANAFDPAGFTDNQSNSTLAILGQADGTKVRILPVADIIAGDAGVLGSPAGVAATYTVNRGEYLQFTQASELTGSMIQSSSPVGIVGGATVMDVPVGKQRADTGQQMLPPIRALGSEYAAVRYRNRLNRPEETPPWRLVGVVPGTELTYDPPQPGAPTTLDGQAFYEFNAPGPFVVKSQDIAHPFYFAQYMTGGHWTDDLDGGGLNPLNGEGDPEWVNVVPPTQFLSRYTFFTDPTYPETNLVVVRLRNSALGLFPDVSIECGGRLTGWQPIDSSDRLEYTRFDLSTGNFQGQNGCDNGVHTLTASFPPGVDPRIAPAFGVTVWGWGNTITLTTDQGTDEENPLSTRWVSYAYPAGANFAPLNTVVVPVK